MDEVTISSRGLKQEISDVMNGARLFQATKCSNCNLPLELPVIHFVCGHIRHVSQANMKDVLVVLTSLSGLMDEYDMQTVFVVTSCSNRRRILPSSNNN